MFKKQNLQQRELNLFEEKSVITGIIPQNHEFKFDDVEKKLSSIRGFSLLEYRPTDTYTGAIIKCKFEEETYEMELYKNIFDGEKFPKIYLTQNYVFSDDEMNSIKESTSAVTVIMRFKKDPRKDFQLQLKVMYKLIPSLAGVIDESAMKVFPPKLIKMIAESKYLVDSVDLYMVHSVYDDHDNIWLHTHGLNRCGITELEIIGANKMNIDKFHNLLNAFASYIIENKSAGFDPLKSSACIGLLGNKCPIFLTAIIWNEAISLFKSLDLGGVKDRKGEHNGLTSVIFTYNSESDIEKGNVIKLIDIDSKLDDNAIIFYSRKESERMSGVAKERISAVYNAYKDKTNEILLKIGLPVENNDDIEHIWFKLLKIDNEKFMCELVQKPFEVKNIKIGDKKEFTLDDITDWIIYTETRSITPNNAYILMDN